MKVINEYHTDDKSSWAEGPWQNEPDKIQFLDEETGYDCLIVRNMSGALCGYVGVPAGHKYHGIHYDGVHLDEDPHGGLTFSDSCRHGADESTGICHVPQNGDDNVWWLGFDCAHLGDKMPAHDVITKAFEMTPYRCVYRDRAYVENEIKNLARELKKTA